MDIKAISQKVDEVKALFILGQRVIPFMEELFIFIGETTPLLEEVNKTIQENLKKMPNASKQLSKVTQATEIASTEIMDTVDRVNDELYNVISDLEGLKSIDDLRLSNPINLLEIIADGIKNGKDLTPMLDDIYLFIDRIKNTAQDENIDIISNTIEKLRLISDDANSIINSLQMQDITSQQLAAVNHLLENIQNRLSSIMTKLTAGDGNGKNNEFDETIKTSKLHRDIAFDPDAIDAMTLEKRQDDVDALFADPNAAFEQGNYEEENTEDLLKMFSNNNENSPDISSENEISDDNNDDGDEEFSQDDIDALFD